MPWKPKSCVRGSFKTFRENNTICQHHKIRHLKCKKPEATGTNGHFLFSSLSSVVSRQFHPNEPQLPLWMIEHGKGKRGEMRQRQLHWLNNAMHSRQATVSCCHHGYVGIQKQLTHTNLCIKEKSFITLIIQPSSGFQPRFTCPWPSIIALDTCLYIVWPLTCTPWSQRHRSPRQRLSLCYCTETEATNGFNSITAKL